MQKLQAVHYGEVELIPGIKCDGYVLSDRCDMFTKKWALSLQKW